VQRLLCKTLTKQASGEPFTDPLQVAAPSLGSTASYADTSGILSKLKAEEDIGGRDKKPKK
jgi:hypothetical protein